MKLSRICVIALCIFLIPLMVFGASCSIKFSSGSRVVTTAKGNQIKGTVSAGANQYVCLYDSKGKLVGYTKADSFKKFSLSAPSLKTGDNIFYVRSLRSGSVDKSSLYKITLRYLKKQSLTTAYDSFQIPSVGTSISIWAKVSSGLGLKYKSSNTKVVTVDSNGKITARGHGQAYVTVYQPGNDTYKGISKAIKIYVPDMTNKYGRFYSPRVRLGEAASGERGLRDNKAGDQSGSEVRMVNYYSGGWRYKFRAKKLDNGLTIADACIKACNNNHIGYDQNFSDRKTFYDEAWKVKFRIEKIKTNCETTCSELANVCIRAAGLTSASRNREQQRCTDTTRLPGNLKSSKDFARTYASGDNLRPGDILISDSHTVVVVKSPSMQAYSIKGACKNGYITNMGYRLKGQDVTCKYQGRGKLKSVEVDGKAINIKKYPNSYTFKNLNKHHTISVVYE